MRRGTSAALPEMNPSAERAVPARFIWKRCRRFKAGRMPAVRIAAILAALMESAEM